MLQVARYVEKRKRLAKEKSYPKDTIILNQFGRGPRAPSISPFALKLETWIRMAKLNYQNNFTIELSPKGKIPWIWLNGEIYSDSQFVIEFLIKKYDKDLSAHLSPVDKAVARSFLKLNEESLRWVGLVFRFKYGKPEDIGLNPLIFRMIAKKVHKETVAQGYGNHEKDELSEIGRDDMRAISNFIGEKKFLLGDQVCNEDASIFGILCQIMYHDKSPLNEFLMSNECSNLRRYIETMKEIYWPDWDQECTENKKKAVVAKS